MRRFLNSILRLIYHKDKALFCDLDGTLIDTISGDTFPRDEHDWYVREEIIYAIKEYNPTYLFIVTNQGGIEKGFVEEQNFLVKLREVARTILKRCRCIKKFDVKYCKSNDKFDPMRKPNPGMILELLKEYNIEKYQALMIGDASGKKGQFSDSDKMTAKNAGVCYMDVNDFVQKYHWDYLNPFEL